MDHDREPNPLGVGAGLDGFAGGIGFILTTPSIWLWAAVPIVVALVLLIGFFSLGAWGVEELRQWAVGDGEGFWSGAANWAIRVVLWLAALVLSLVAALSLAQPLSGLALDRIVYGQERALTGRRSPDLPLLASLWRTVRVSLFTLFAGLFIFTTLLVVNLLFPPAMVVTVPLKFLFGGWLLAWNFLDYPLAIRGHGVRSRLRWMGRHFNAATAFGLVWAVLLLIPGIALLVLPMGVAGATRLVVAAKTEYDLG